MATLTDRLVTVLELQGIGALTGGLAQSAQGFSAVAAAEGVAAAATTTLGAALDFLAANPLILVIAGITTLVAGMGKALSAFSESEKAIGRLATELRDMGNVFPADQLVAFANHMQDLTGISHRQIEALGGLAASFGLTRAQIEKMMPVIIDISVARNLTPEQVLQRMLRSTQGISRGLIGLGIDPRRIKGDIHDINNLISQLGAQFGGTAQAFRNTLPGTVEALGTSVTRLFEALGRFISPAVVPVLNLLISAVDKLSAALTTIADAFPGLFPTAADLGKDKPNDLALKGDPEQTGLLKGIEQNTSGLDKAISQIYGGSGEVLRRSYTVRDMRMARGI